MCSTDLHLHFVTFRCYRRLPLLGTVRARNLFVKERGRVRREYRFLIVGFVVMPNHVHLLISEPKKGTPSALSTLGELFLPLEGLVDVEAEKARLKRELAKNDSEIEKAKLKLNNADFVQKVPPNVLEEHKKRLAEWQAKRQQVISALDSLQG